MSARRDDRSPAIMFYRACLAVYPPSFRREYGAEMLDAFRGMRDERSSGGSALAFWVVVLFDLLRSVPAEWAVEMRSAVLSTSGSEDPRRPPYFAAGVAGLATFVLFTVTLAPTVAFWDAGEYMTAAHVLGIPHPPGSALFVMLARAWEILLSPTGLATAVRLNLLSAALSASAHAVWYLVVDRALVASSRDRLFRTVGATAAVMLSATAFTVWNQSNVIEKVYGVSLFTTALVTWLALRWRDNGRNPKLLLVIGFVLALSATNHLMGFLAAPAILIFVIATDWRALWKPRLWMAGLPIVAIGLSAQLFLPIRAAQDPLVSEGAPSCESFGEAVASVYSWGRTGCEPLSAVISREQYGKPSILLDPRVYPASEVPRSLSLTGLQFANYLQYFDWQWGRSIAGADPLFGGLRPVVTLLMLLLGTAGLRAIWRRDRPAAALLGILFLTLSVGLVIYLNFRNGFSIGRTSTPASSFHEVRERDYFFLIGFSVWGLLAGIGLAHLWRRVAGALDGRFRTARWAAALPLMFAALPLILNWNWASRTEDLTAHDWAYNVLMSVGPYGVLVTNGDNDSFPLLHAQMVEGVRRDVTILLAPYLNTPWFIRQTRDLTRPCPPDVSADDDPTRILCQRDLDPDALPPALARLGWADRVNPPSDSIVPLSDDEIDAIASRFFVTDRPMTFSAGRVVSTIESGTPIMPADTFAAAILNASLGKRPIHFMPGAQIVSTLGLLPYAVRQGITWRINDGPLPPDGDDPGLRRLPTSGSGGFPEAAIDLAMTDTLFDEVYLTRGRILDPRLPWVDSAAANIPLQYAYAHYAAAQAYAAGGDDSSAMRHVRRAEWWQSVVGG